MSDAAVDPQPQIMQRKTDCEISEDGCGKLEGEPLDNHLAECFPALLDAIRDCVKEADVKCIDVGNLGLETAHMKAIFNLLPTAQVVELNAENSNVQWGMPEFAFMLRVSNVQKLSFKNCRLRVLDVLALMEALQHTQVKDLDLSQVSFSELYPPQSGKAIFANLIKSHLTHLRLTASSLLDHSSGKNLAFFLPQTSITHLWLEQTGLCHNKEALEDLFKNLPKTSVTELYLGCNEIEDDQLRPLSDSLKLSKLKKLDLSCNKITDAGVKLLFEALVGSQVQELLLTKNSITAINNITPSLMFSNIKVLHLGKNKITNSGKFPQNFLPGTYVTELHLDQCDCGDEVGQSLASCLKSSKVVKMTLSGNRLGSLTVSEFASVIKETKITEVDFSENNFSAEVVELLGESLAGSSLRKLALRGSGINLQEGSSIASLVDKTKGTSLESLDISWTSLTNEIAILAVNLMNATITHLNLSSSQIGAGVADLAAVLKHTAITHLNVSNNKIDDFGAKKLAESMNETDILHLDASNNLISDKGAKSLVLCLKSGPLYQLNLEYNKITNKGIKELAKMIEGTFITHLKVAPNEGCNVLPLTTVIWRNQITERKWTGFFRAIAPFTFDVSATAGGVFCFNSYLIQKGTSFNMFVENCLLFYKTMTEDPSGFSALAMAEGTPHFSRNQVSTLVFDVLPKQFTSFVKNQVKLTELIKIFERAKALGLKKIVELLLSTLAAMIIDKKEETLQGPIFDSLTKHKEALCNLELGPAEKKKLVRYLAKRPRCCGLCGKSEKLTRTPCCKNWVCDDEHKYELMSFARTSCIRNHRKYTLCGGHYEKKHKGRWQDCKKCKEDGFFENYVDWGTNDYNFEKLKNPPKLTITCDACGFQAPTLKDFGCQNNNFTYNMVSFYCAKLECQRQAYLGHEGCTCLPMVTALDQYKKEASYSALKGAQLKWDEEKVPKGNFGNFKF